MDTYEGNWAYIDRQAHLVVYSQRRVVPLIPDQKGYLHPVE